MEIGITHHYLVPRFIEWVCLCHHVKEFVSILWKISEIRKINVISDCFYAKQSQFYAVSVPKTAIQEKTKPIQSQFQTHFWLKNGGAFSPNPNQTQFWDL